SQGINTGSNTLAPASDIENVLRPQGAAIDRGAYEFRSGTNTPPSVSITAPANNASFTVGAAILITANATDTDGTIAKVEFFQGATKIGEDLTSPYSFSWTGAAIGTYTLTAKATDNAAATSTSAPVSISISGTTTGSCVIKPIPDATKYELRNGWNDQNNGSKVSNTADALQISHRAWGSPYIWVIESGTPYVVSTGKHYNVSFDFKDDANIKASAIQVAFVSVIGNGGDPTLLQPAVTASSGYSSTTFTTETASILASTGGTAYLSFKLNWSGQPNLILNDYVKNITICEVSPTARWAADDTIEDLNIYPNPASQQVTIKHDFSNDEILQIQLMDATGMLHNTYQGYGKESTIELDADLSPGLYLLKVKGSNKEKVYRFIKE
ncbi:MAG TPA: Ig-like domain-containing protein, partial [Cytophagales bacterium]|nr:Ig-like domain-containing protein [Cytophagales bacterium]